MIRSGFVMPPMAGVAITTLAFLLVFGSTGCATRPLDPWTEFMDSVLASARTADYDALLHDLTLVRWEEIIEFYRQASVVDATEGQTQPPEAQLVAAMRKDVQMFVRSYADLLDGRAAAYSTKRLPIDGVECYSVILWVRQGGTYNGILIHAVWRRPTGFRVLEWVDTAPAAAAGIEIWKKRARLSAPDRRSCVFPVRIEYDQEFRH